jgi:hypothetical protein
MAGNQTVADALQKSQGYAQTVAKNYQKGG